MFAYLLIAAELIILSTVFWYVFLKEPRPFELKDNLWGYYDKSLDVYTTYGAQSVQQFMRADCEGWLKEGNSHERHDIARTRPARHASYATRCPQDSLKNGWISGEVKSSSAVGNLLAALGSKLTQLSVKFN